MRSDDPCDPTEYLVDVNGVGDCGTGRSIIVEPSGHVIHEAGAGPEFMPVEVDFDRVRRERERGAGDEACLISSSVPMVCRC